MIGESINPALYTRVIIERVVVKVAELRGVPLKDGALERCGNVSSDKGSVSEGHKALKTLHKEADIPVIYVFFYQYYFTLSIYSIEVGVKIA